MPLGLIGDIDCGKVIQITTNACRGGGEWYKLSGGLVDINSYKNIRSMDFESIQFVNKKRGDSHSWDESMLIKSYAECVTLGSEDVAKHIASNTNAGATKILENESSNLIEFNVGDYVRSTYCDDGCDYEAKILSKDNSNGTCLVKYIGYDNEEIVNIKDLLPSWGKKSRRLQFQQTTARGRKDIHGSTVNKKKILIDAVPPPPPLPTMLAQSTCDSEHLSAMLMSWYMSGYYTGIYEGIKIAKKKKTNKPD